MVLENAVLRMYCVGTDEVTGERRKLLGEEIHDLLGVSNNGEEDGRFVTSLSISSTDLWRLM